MKSFKLAAAFCMLATWAQAQPLTGQSYYGHNGQPALLTSGTYVSTNPGFLMGGHVPSVPAGSPNFFLDKTDVDGNFTGSPGEFSNEYYFFDAGQGCGSAFAQETNCYGVSVVESINTSGVLEYGLTAAFDAGILFATLDNTGAVLAEALIQIPVGAVPASNPLICASRATGDYYLAGSYNSGGTTFMYVARMTPAATGVWSSLYDIGANNAIRPGGIVEDTYSGVASPQLNIAGFIVTNPALGTDGFYLALNGNSGAINLQEGFGSGSFSNEWFSSIALSNSINGYILGGYSDFDPATGHAWMVNLNGPGTINWSSRITPSTDNQMGDVVGVTERRSAAYGAYEFYGAAISNGSNGGMLVLKLDQNGNAFSQPGNMDNEFLYNDNAGNIALTTAISSHDDASMPNNTGIHVFGTVKNGPSEFFLDQACFNGATGTCANPTQQNLTQINSVVTGPSIVYTTSFTKKKGLPLCPRHQLRHIPISYAPTQPCSMNTMPVAPYAGNNSRNAAATGIGEKSLNADGLAVYPNPVSSVAEISYNLSKGSEVKISLSNVLGQHIKTLDAGYKEAGSSTLQVDMKGMGLQDGIYLVNINVNGTSSQQKIIYTK